MARPKKPPQAPPSANPPLPRPSWFERNFIFTILGCLAAGLIAALLWILTSLSGRVDRLSEGFDERVRESKALLELRHEAQKHHREQFDALCQGLKGIWVPDAGVCDLQDGRTIKYVELYSD